MNDAAILGPTASGKSAFALRLAQTDATWEIVSVDSMQVYRGMDIGTAKPRPAERARVRHHLLDLVDPWQEFSLVAFQDAARRARADIHARGRRALLVGGTGLYLRAVVDELEIPGRYPEVAAEIDAEPEAHVLHTRLAELDPVAASRMEPTNRRRIVRALEVTVGSGRPFSSYGPGLGRYEPTDVTLVGLAPDTAELDGRIERRIRDQLEAGWVAEVAGLLRIGRPLSRSAAQALGYREIAEDLGRPGHSRDDLIADIAARTRRFARRQMRWFRRDPRIAWCDPADGWEAVAGTIAVGGHH